MSGRPSTDDGVQRLSRFLNAAEGIKNDLGDRLGTSFTGLGEAVRAAIKANIKLVVVNRRTLNVLVDSRNVIQHSHYKNGEPLAVPRLDAVEAIEQLHSQLSNRPPVHKFMIKNPEVVDVSNPLQDVMPLISSRDLSQLPVVHDSTYVGLLTTNMIARWLADVLIRNNGDLIEESVAVESILKFAEPQDHAEFITPNAPALDVAYRLTNANGPAVLLVTPSGRESADISGILTRSDVSTVMQAHVATFP